MVYEFPARLPRHAFTPRDSARAADIWRLCQEIATDGSTAAGWPPGRYRTEGIGFVVRELVCVHHRETSHGELLTARTWVTDFRRGMLTNREIRIAGPKGPLASASQEWVHVKADPERKNPDAPPLKPARASAELVASFQPASPEPSVAFPAVIAAQGPTSSFTFTCWETWMDPLAHANHPMYVDWGDEAVSRILRAQGREPAGLIPRAERVRWRTGVVAGETVEVALRVIGHTDAGDTVFEGEIKKGNDVAATIALVRAHTDGRPVAGVPGVGGA